jgi:hypothetical protein
MKNPLQKKFAQAYFQMAQPKVNFHMAELKDYYKHRDYLQHHQFQNQALKDLCALFLGTLDLPKRLDRLRLLEDILSFAKKGGTALDDESTHSLVAMFQRLTTDQWERFFDGKRQRPYWNCVKILQQLPLTDTHWKCFLNQCPSNPKVRPVIENTQHQIPGMGEWVSEHFQSDFVIERRTHYSAHLMDNDPEYVIPKEVILSDCDRLNALDQQYIDEKISDYEQQKLLINAETVLLNANFPNYEEEAEPYENEGYTHARMGMDDDRKLDSDDPMLLFYAGYSERQYRRGASPFRGFQSPYCFLPHHSRLYPIPSMKDPWSYIFYPDFFGGRQLLEQNIDTVQAKYMVWSLAYSRLPRKQKFKQMHRWWRPENALSWLHVAKKFGYPEMLEGRF